MTVTENKNLLKNKFYPLFCWLPKTNYVTNELKRIVTIVNNSGLIRTPCKITEVNWLKIGDFV